VDNLLIEDMESILETEAEEKGDKVILIHICLICKKPGHESKDCRFRCTRCKITNHSDRDGWHKKKEGDERMKGITFSAEDDAHKLFSTMINDKKSGEIWFLDSGWHGHHTICAGAGVRTPGTPLVYLKVDFLATRLLDPKKKKKNSSHVELGDGNHVKIEGKGIVAVHTSEGK
jgi:hypothetical protein